MPVGAPDGVMAAAACAAVEQHLRLDGRVAAGVEDLARPDHVLNGAHDIAPWAPALVRRRVIRPVAVPCLLVGDALRRHDLVAPFAARCGPRYAPARRRGPSALREGVATTEKSNSPTRQVDITPVRTRRVVADGSKMPFGRCGAQQCLQRGTGVSGPGRIEPHRARLAGCSLSASMSAGRPLGMPFR